MWGKFIGVKICLVNSIFYSPPIFRQYTNLILSLCENCNEKIYSMVPAVTTKNKDKENKIMTPIKEKRHK